MAGKFFLIRDIWHPGSTLGQFVYEKFHICYSLELPWKNNERGVSCISEGEYDIMFMVHPKFGRCIYFPFVEGRSEVFMHVANRPEQLRGCIAPGLTRYKDFVGHSRTGLNRICDIFKAENVTYKTLQIIDVKHW